MPYLKLAALMLLVLVIGIPAASATPESQRLSEEASPRLNLDYLAPEVRSVFGPDTFLAAPPIRELDPIEDPHLRCVRGCQYRYEDNLKECLYRYGPPDVLEGGGIQCREMVFNWMLQCKRRCELTPA